jgi:tRNA threonylcarbamoyladenosine biosynthesis protein TsaB
VDAQAAPDIAWVAWLGAAVDPDTAPPRPFYLRPPDAKPSQNLSSQNLPSQNLPHRPAPPDAS